MLLKLRTKLLKRSRMYGARCSTKNRACLIIYLRVSCIDYPEKGGEFFLPCV